MISKGDIVRVIVPGLFTGQEVQVLKVDEKSWHHRRTSTWYLLDTIEPRLKFSRPGWFERHEIEPVEQESSNG